MYALARDHNNNGECSSGSDPIWKKVWGFHIHPKAKMFLWRALWDILPHRSNLQKKGIENVGKCCRCGLEESNNHVLRDYFWARKVWQKFRLCMEFQQPYVSIREWMGMILQHHNQEEAELFAVILWKIWGSRNAFIFEKIHYSPDYCYSKANDLLLEYRKANVMAEKDKIGRAKAAWTPPGAGFIKVNVDAAVNEQDDRFGIGIVARDVSGKVIYAASKTLWPFSTVKRAELETFYWAVKVSHRYHWHNIILEGDT